MKTNLAKNPSILEVIEGIGTVGFGCPQLGHIFALTEQFALQITHC
jgi:hypothetical protein